MKKKSFLFISFLGIILAPALLYSQYIAHGSATPLSCNCYSLTSESANQNGIVWRSTPINLNNSFDFSFKVYLGCVDDGADGIAFILGQDTGRIGTPGQGMGFQGIDPSVDVSLDTYQNIGNDPAFDHISIQANGDIIHTDDLAGPVPASAVSNNIKDCNWHILRITWNTVTHTISTYFDGNFRLSSQTDIVANIFNNSPLVFWGFSGSTGAHYNLQQFCTPLTPDFIANMSKDSICLGTSIIFKDQSVSYSAIQNYHWDFGDGTTSSQSNPSHQYLQPGIYNVTHTVTAEDGCTSEVAIKIITVADKPKVSFSIYDTCRTITPRLENNTTVNVGWVSQWNWLLDGVSSSNMQHPSFNNLTAGNHSVSLIAISNYGCTSDTATKNFNIKNKPDADIIANNGCVNNPILFEAQQKDTLTTINNWHWNFGDGASSGLQNTDHFYTIKNTYNVQLTATAANGCTGSFSKNIVANKAEAFAGNDTVVLANTSFWLHGSGGEFYNWSPATGLSNSMISNPFGNAANDMAYLLTVKTIEGCTDTSSIKISVFKGSAIYVPTAFTPNNDGHNDVLKPMYIGIKSVTYFIIYDRWGRSVFSTNDLHSGWNGSFKRQDSDTGSYVWILKATDLIGKVYNLKGSFTLLR